MSRDPRDISGSASCVLCGLSCKHRVCYSCIPEAAHVAQDSKVEPGDLTKAIRVIIGLRDDVDFHAYVDRKFAMLAMSKTPTWITVESLLEVLAEINGGVEGPEHGVQNGA